MMTRNATMRPSSPHRMMSTSAGLIVRRGHAGRDDDLPRRATRAVSGPGDPAVGAAADAYVWGYPLVVMHRTRAAQAAGPWAGMVARKRLATAADRSVVAPNNDTLYSSGWFDLRAGDLTIEVDAMDRPDRYWSVMLLDAYTSVAYVCRRLHGVDGTTVHVTYDPGTRPDPARASTVVPIATPTVWVLARVLVDGPDDLADAVAVQSTVRVRQPGADAGTVEVPPDPSGLGTGGDVFDELRAALLVDPPAPWHPPLPPAAEAVLRRPPSAEVLGAGAEEGEARIRASGTGSDRTGNGWGTRFRGADFGDDVTYRAAFAKVSLAGHLPAENRSYLRGFDGSRPATLRFGPGGDPPVAAFWSLCVYGPDLFFVDNEIDRYSIGDRTDGLRRDADGGLTIAIGPDRPPDPANWLPTGPGRCFLALRAYEGSAAIVDATWFPPAPGRHWPRYLAGT